MTSVENLNCPYYQELTISQKESSFLKVILKIELTLLSWAKFFQKYDSFDDITWNLNFPLLSRAETFTKIPLNIANCPFYHKLKFLQK